MSDWSWKEHLDQSSFDTAAEKLVHGCLVRIGSMRDARCLSHVKLGSGRLEVGGGKCGCCCLWLGYGCDMLIMLLCTHSSPQTLIFMTGETH